MDSKGQMARSSSHQSLKNFNLSKVKKTILTIRKITWSTTLVLKKLMSSLQQLMNKKSEITELTNGLVVATSQEN